MFFGGEIAQAVEQCRQTGKFLLIFIDDIPTNPHHPCLIILNSTGALVSQTTVTEADESVKAVEAELKRVSVLNLLLQQSSAQNQQASDPTNTVSPSISAQPTNQPSTQPTSSSSNTTSTELATTAATSSERQLSESERVYRQLKLDQQRARDEIKRQINLDRLNTQASSTTSALNSSRPTTAPKADASGSGQGFGMEMPQQEAKCHLAIRLLDGSTLRSSFDPTMKLSEIHTFISQNAATTNATAYKLLRVHPSYMVLDALEHKTLLELGMCPSATITLKPVESNRVHGQVSETGLAGMMGSWIGSLWGVVTWPVSYLVGPSTASASDQTGEGASATQSDMAAQHEASQSQIRNQTMDLRERRIKTLSDINAGSGSTPKKAGSDGKDDKEKRETYNGNSTNQE